MEAKPSPKETTWRRGVARRSVSRGVRVHGSVVTVADQDAYRSSERPGTRHVNPGTTGLWAYDG